MLKCPKHLWNLHESTFIKYFNTSGKKWFGKNLPYWNLKSYGSFLTHWLQMIRILFAILRIWSSLFKCNFHKIEELFSVFSLSVLESSSYFKHLKKKIIVIASVFSKLQTVKVLFRPPSKKRRFRISFDSQHVKVSQTLVKSAWEQIYQIF